MELLLLCAGAADKTLEGAKTDRPLRTKGKRQAQKIGAWMGRHGLQPDLVLTASDYRSKVTAQKALKAGGWTAGGITRSSNLDKGKLPDPGKSERALLVARPKRLQELAQTLGVDLVVAPGVLVHMSYEDGSARLITRIDPDDLPNFFPYPFPDGPEARERPAYYYTQSAVIPYRQTPTGKEILIVGSSSGRHWVVPKGIVDPGLSPAESARVEAREEAGVEGVVSGEPLGKFIYEKWGAPCQVEVYAMEVTRVLRQADWEESHRLRKWVSPETAAEMLYQEAFRSLIAQL